jgi:hypothetical protein
MSAKMLDMNDDRITCSNAWLALRDDIERRVLMDKTGF